MVPRLTILSVLIISTTCSILPLIPLQVQYLVPIRHVQPEHRPQEPNHIPNYRFAYSVNDEHTGDIKHQQETRHGGTVIGQYSLIQPDGIRRTVDYRADDARGFLATVNNNGGNLNRQSDDDSQEDQYPQLQSQTPHRYPQTQQRQAQSQQRQPDPHQLQQAYPQQVQQSYPQQVQQSYPQQVQQSYPQQVQQSQQWPPQPQLGQYQEEQRQPQPEQWQPLPQSQENDASPPAISRSSIVQDFQIDHSRRNEGHKEHFDFRQWKRQMDP